jgi:cytochrome c oxidase accessory protein FixG
MNPDATTPPTLSTPTSGAASARVVIPIHPAPQRLHPRASQGRFTRLRWVFVLLTQAFFLGIPWLQIDGRQALLFYLEQQRFDVFGLVLWPQDLVYLTGLLVASALLLFLATALAGRVWCGFSCPQTVYTEIFLWIERRFEGDRTARLRLDRAPWHATKLLRRGGKHLAWMVFALWTGFTFTGYFTPIRELAASIPAGTVGPWDLFWTGFYTLATYGNAGWLREQVCLHMCPYARFQGSMMDPRSLVVGYDAARGEPRRQRATARQDAPRESAPGACVDCTLCVQVCPVGIDIRNGLQYECIGCGVCIDACDQVMDQIHQPRGLIRFADRDGAAAPAGWWSRLLRPRVAVYSALLGLTVAAMGVGLLQRAPLRVDILRDRGVLARPVEDGAVENVYRLQLMNATGAPLQGRLAVQDRQGGSLLVDPADTVPLAAAGTGAMVVRVRLPAERALAQAGHTLPVDFVIEVALADGRLRSVRESSTFIVPR